MLRTAPLIRTAASFVLAVFASTFAARGDAGEPIVAAASDLQFALKEITEVFAKSSGQRVRLVFGSSGNLATQMRSGAPFELFLSADEQLILDLARDGLVADEGVVYAEGRLALFVPTGSKLNADASLQDLAAAADDGRLGRLAIANPEHAPYGRRAKEALEHLGLWEKLSSRLVFGENVSQAAQFAVSGAASGGIVAYSLLRASEFGSKGSFALIPALWHEPLRQRMALAPRASASAINFYGHLQSEQTRVILKQHGFTLPK
jgi:molybdate transport system substrate-binding protein